MANAYYKNGSSWINMANVFYPVGAYYLANTNTSPSSLFGGTWSNLTGRFLYCNNGTAQNGENSHKLTISEMPSHTHNIIAQGPLFRQGSSSGRYVYVSDTNEAWSNRITSTGGSSAHNNMPAYRTCYCWYRTA